jgi:hypothetical protein
MRAPERQKVVAEAMAQEIGAQVTLEYRLLDQRPGDGAKDDSIRDIMTMFPGSEIV